MEAFVSLWSADPLALGVAVRQVEDLVDGFHIDVFDGHNVPDLLFGPDLVAALHGFTTARIEVHLNVTDPDYWIDRFAEAGASIITVQSGPCRDVPTVLEHIRARGCEAGLGIELHEPTAIAARLLPLASRLLLLGTPIGVRGQQLDPSAPARVRELVALRARVGGEVTRRPPIAVDGGIRRHTVPVLAAAGADGIIPGSLVFGANDPRGALAEIAALTAGVPVPAESAFWIMQAPA
jgi:ribulose-phosphate 3-epimerase